MSELDDYSPITLARVTPWSRDQWQEARTIVDMDGRLEWPDVARMAIKSGYGPSFVAALVSALVPKPIRVDP